MISSSHRPLPDNTQHSQHTDIHAPGGIRTHNLSGRATVDLRLRPRGHWDRNNAYLEVLNNFESTYFRFLTFTSYRNSSHYILPTVIPSLFHTAPHNGGISPVLGRGFLFPVDVRTCLELPATASQPFTPRDRPKICGHQQFDSALETEANRSATYFLNYTCDNWRIKPTRCHLLFYFTSYRLNMFRALLCNYQELATMMLITTVVVSFLVCCRLEVGCD